MKEFYGHTPGEWVIKKSNLFPGQQVIMEKDDNGRILAVVDKVDETDNANARLIASAPELLEACKHAVNAILRGSHDLTNEMHASLDELQQAITKAEA